MTRLRTVSSAMPGWRRRHHGKGFTYLNGTHTLTGAERQRCVDLVIPPAWTDVWICPVANGHLQVVGTDEAGRRQYLYHPAWRLQRDREKFSFMLEFAAALPRARRRVARDLRREQLDLEWACALAFRLLDLGAFRIGTQRYAEENGSHGLLTLERRHLSESRAGFSFEYVAKSGQPRALTTRDAAACAALRVLRRRRAPADERLLAHKEGGRWHELTNEQVSGYLKERLGDDASAKDFRTWQANVLAAACLATAAADSKKARKKAIAETMTEVADFLGNTPAVARSGYVDPQLLDLFEDGRTIDPALARRQMPQTGKASGPAIEKAVLGLLSS